MSDFCFARKTERENELEKLETEKDTEKYIGVEVHKRTSVPYFTPIGIKTMPKTILKNTEKNLKKYEDLALNTVWTVLFISLR